MMCYMMLTDTIDWEQWKGNTGRQEESQETYDLWRCAQEVAQENIKKSRRRK